MLASLITTQSIIVYHCMSWRSNKGINLPNQGYFSVVKSVQTDQKKITSPSPMM